MSGGDFKDQLTEVEVFSQKRSQFYAAEITLALQFLHKHGILHWYLLLLLPPPPLPLPPPLLRNLWCETTGYWDLGLWPLCSWCLCSSRRFHGIDRQFVSEVLGQGICSIFRSPPTHEECHWWRDSRKIYGVQSVSKGKFGCGEARGGRHVGGWTLSSSQLGLGKNDWKEEDSGGTYHSSFQSPFYPFTSEMVCSAHHFTFSFQTSLLPMMPLGCSHHKLTSWAPINLPQQTYVETYIYAHTHITYSMGP